MLIDWITARAEMTAFPRESWDQLRDLADRVIRYCPRSGEVVWETCAWDSVRSDSHQLAFRVGSDAVWMQGSPGRCIGSGDTVFGEGAASALDLVACLQRMAAFVSGVLGVPFPIEPHQWKVSRVDVTGNLELDDLPAVRVALRILRDCEGGRYRVSQQAGDTVYWSHRSRLRSGKAYAKGPHLRYQVTKPGYTGRAYSEREQGRVDRLLRLELKLAAQWWRERVSKPWHEITADELKAEWHDYFGKMIGDADMNTGETIKDRILKAAKTPGQGAAAYACWLNIEKHGWQETREMYLARNGKPSRTWYRHISVFHAAGLGDADIATGQVVQLRRKILECRLVDSWPELLRAA